MTEPVTDRLVVLDDAEYYIELDTTSDAEDIAAGYLKRRCYVSPTSPGGYECIGRFSLNGTRTLGVYPTRINDIVFLWLHQREAHSRHAD